MKVTFPHLGSTHIVVKILFDALGIPYVIPPTNSKESLRLGSLISPEEICIPFKLMMGNYIQSIQEGADTILIVGSCGPCRLGEYCELQRQILKEQGYNLNFIVIDSIKDKSKKDLIKKIVSICGYNLKSNGKKIKAMQIGVKALSLLDNIENKVRDISGYELVKGQGKKLLDQCKKELKNTNDPKKAINILKKYLKIIKNIEIDKKKDPVKIAIVGEFYTIIEPFTNFYIEEKLMNYGVNIRKLITTRWWVKDMLLKSIKLNSLHIRKASNKYLKYYIGGHARECVGETVLAHKDGYDGAIQIYPMGCTPEIISKSIISSISRDKDFSIMTLVIDEVTGELGYITRIEAFIDLLERKRKNVLLRN